MLNSYQRLKETVLFGLRMNKGVNFKVLQNRYKALLTDEDWKTIKRFQAAQFLSLRNQNLKATEKGQLVLDELCGYLA